MQADRWTIKISTKLEKTINGFSDRVKEKLIVLFKDLEIKGFNQPTWPNFGKLGESLYHCHIKKGRPTYVVCWRIKDYKNKIIEVYYVGTHEKAPY